VDLETGNMLAAGADGGVGVCGEVWVRLEVGWEVQWGGWVEEGGLGLRGERGGYWGPVALVVLIGVWWGEDVAREAGGERGSMGERGGWRDRTGGRLGACGALDGVFVEFLGQRADGETVMVVRGEGDGGRGLLLGGAEVE
jgi:hypothetical protein